MDKTTKSNSRVFDYFGALSLGSRRAYTALLGLTDLSTLLVEIDEVKRIDHSGGFKHNGN